MQTKSGFDFELQPNALDDWELMEDLGAVTAENPDFSAASSVFVRLLGKDQYAKLKEHVRDNGKVSVKAMLAELENIFETAGDQAKNS